MSNQPNTQTREATNTRSVRFKLDVNRKVKNKVKQSFGWLHSNFKTEELTLDELAAIVRAGHAFTAPFKKVHDEQHATTHYKDNVLFVPVLWLDSDTGDERSTFAYWLQQPLVRDYGALLYTTSSHTPDAPRVRVLFVLDKPLDIPKSEAAHKALFHHFAHVDQSVHDASRTLYGAQNCQLLLLGNVLPLDVLRQEVVGPYLDKLEADRRRLQEARDRHARELEREPGPVNDSQVANYIERTLDAILDDVAGAREGTGLRHEQLRNGSVRLYSLRAAGWLDDDARRLLSNVDEQLLNAARANGYASKYGDAEALRIIQSGERIAAPAEEPVWNTDSAFVSVGDVVSLRLPGRQASGQVSAVKTVKGDWHVKVNNAWWPKSALNQADKNSLVQTIQDDSSDSDELAADDDDNASGSTNASEVEPKNASGTSVRGSPDWNPPPPPPTWNDEDTLAADFFVKVPEGDWLAGVDFQLPERAILDANTGIGKTTYAATCGNKSERVIVAMSSIVALRQQAAKYPNAAVCYEHEKTLTPSSRLAFVTYDQLASVAELMDEWQMDFASVRLFVDEQHNLALAGYRRRTLDKLLEVVANYDWKSVTFMSGTPLQVPHSTLSDFKYVKVNSHRRQQNAVLVRWKDEDKGKKRDAIVELVKRHKRVLVHLDNKGAELEGLVAALVASGVDLATIYTLNSDNKYEALGQQITECETVPDDCRVLIVTSVFVESSNMQTRFDAGIVASAIHPAYAQQFANRQRGERAMDVVYVLHSGTGAGYSFDISRELVHTTSLAMNLANDLNAIEDARAAISEDARRVFGGEYGALVRREGKRLSVDELGVAQHVHRSATLYANQNATCYKNMTLEYRWRWQEDEALVVDDSNKSSEQRQRERELRQEAAEVAKKDWQERVAFVYSLGHVSADNERYLAMYEAKLMRVIVRALELYELTEDWTGACALLATATDSTQSFNKLKRMLLANKLRSAGDDFAQAVQGAFQLGKAYTQDERHKRLVDVYMANEAMKPFVTEVYPYSWSQEPRAKVDKRGADDILRLLFEVSEQRVRIEGEQVRQWTFTGREPLEARLVEGREHLKANAAPVPPNYYFIKDNTQFGGTAGYVVDDSQTMLDFDTTSTLDVEPELPGQAPPEREGEDILDAWLELMQR